VKALPWFHARKFLDQVSSYDVFSRFEKSLLQSFGGKGEAEFPARNRSGAEGHIVRRSEPYSWWRRHDKYGMSPDLSQVNAFQTDGSSSSSTTSRWITLFEARPTALGRRESVIK
jgi:hypothetical protein